MVKFKQMKIADVEIFFQSINNFIFILYNKFFNSFLLKKSNYNYVIAVKCHINNEFYIYTLIYISSHVIFDLKKNYKIAKLKKYYNFENINYL